MYHLKVLYEVLDPCFDLTLILELFTAFFTKVAFSGMFSCYDFYSWHYLARIIILEVFMFAVIELMTHLDLGSIIL